MSTNQPIREFVANLGDINICDYGGFIVYRDTTGVYPPEAEIYEPNEHEGTGGMVYRFPLDPPRFKTFKKYIGEDGREYQYCDRADMDIPSKRNVTWYWYNEWYVDKLDSIASTCGTTKRALLRQLLSKDPVDRGSAYRDIVGNFGPFEFDQYPLKLTEREARKRYKSVEKLSRTAVYGK